MDALQNIGSVLFWIMAWYCVYGALCPKRQPLFSRFAGALMLIGLALVSGARWIDEAAVAEIGRPLCYLAIGVLLWREILWFRYAGRILRRRARAMAARKAQVHDVMRTKDEP